MKDALNKDHSEGKEIEFPDGAVVEKVFEHFQISANGEYIAFINNKLARSMDPLSDGMTVTLMQPLCGG